MCITSVNANRKNFRLKLQNEPKPSHTHFHATSMAPVAGDGFGP